MMKKYLLYPLFILFAFAGCNDDDNSIIDDGGQTIDYGDVVAKFEAKKFDGTVTRQVTMGELVTYFDISDGRPDKRTWTLPGAEPQSSDRLMTAVIYPIPGTYKVTLNVERTSDGQTDEVSVDNYIEVLSIPVEAAFSASVVEEGGVINIKTGDVISFTDLSTGLPELWNWQFAGGTPATSTEQSPSVQYLTPGTYTVTFKATRDDAGNLVESEITKTAYVNVVQRVVDYAGSGVATDDKIKIKYTEPLAQTIPANATSEFTVSIKTAAGATLTPSVTAISRVDDYTLELTFSDKMYSDDLVLLSYNPTGIIKDATGLYNPEPLTDDACMNGKNLWDNNIYSYEAGHENWSVPAGNTFGEMTITDEKSLSGKYSMKLTSTAGTEWIGGSGAGSKATLTPGTTYSMSWYVWRDPSSTHAALGPWLAWTGGQTQYWTDMNTYPKGEWYRITKELTYSGTGDGWFWLRVKDNNIIYVDNISIVVPDPRP